MIHGVRGLAALAAAVVVLALVIAVDAPSNAALVDRAIFASFVEDQVVALRWNRPGSAEFAVEHERNGMWMLVVPTRSAADPRTVQAVLATLRSARWHRRAPRSHAGEIRATLGVATVASQIRAVGLGDQLQGADQAWIAIDDAAYLVDGWVVRALFVDMLALRDREPLGDVAAGGTPIRIASDRRAFDLQPRPWRDARGILAPDVVDPLIGALSQLRLVSIPSRATPPIDRTIIALPDRGVSLAVGGTCPGTPHQIAVSSPDGDGCVEAERWNSVLAALSALSQPAGQVLDRRLAAGDLATIELGDGTIHLDGRPTLDIEGTTHLADPARVRELLTALATAAAVVPAPTGTPHATIEVTLRSGVRMILSRYGATFVRGEETIGLRSAAADIIVRPIASYIDPMRWIDDPTAISELEVTTSASDARPGSPKVLAATFLRGPVVGEWIRSGQRVSAATAALVDALADAVAEVQATAAEIPRSWNPVGTVRVTFSPPVGAPTTHVLELGRPGPRGCFARIDGAASLAPLGLCTAAMAVTTSL